MGNQGHGMLACILLRELPGRIAMKPETIRKWCSFILFNNFENLSRFLKTSHKKKSFEVPWYFQPAETRASGRMTQCFMTAGYCTVKLTEPELRDLADRSWYCVLMSKEVMKHEPTDRQKYRQMKYLHKFGHVAIGQPQ